MGGGGGEDGKGLEGGQWVAPETENQTKLGLRVRAPACTELKFSH